MSAGGVNKEITSGMDLGIVCIEVTVSRWPGMCSVLVSREMFKEGDVKGL